jgi:serine/threonine protein kinase
MQIWQPNQTIKDSRFLIQKKLGMGGFGITYLAEDRQKRQRVVIKTLNANRQDAPDFRQIQEKFVNEALKLSQFRHPHIVRVQELIQEGDLWGIVMEYIDGVELSEYVLERGKLEEAEALAYIDKIAQALDYVHKQGVLHRDVKPHNIMLRQIERYPILIDFGLAREFIDDKTMSMTNSLTHGYAPPEQYDRHGKFAAYTDVYALAATLYHLLTGQIPIPANYRQYPNVNLSAPKDYESGITDRVSDAIMQGMAIDFHQRPQNMTEFRKLLGLIQELPSPDSLQSKQANPLLEEVKLLTSTLKGTGAHGHKVQPHPIVAKQKLIDLAKVFLLLSILAASGGVIYIYATLTTIPSSTSSLGATPAPEPTPPPERTSQISDDLSRAKLLIKPGDATSRYVAILSARKISPTTPAAATEIQQSIEQWSQEIYQIAQGYANKQFWRLAIDTAKMVPNDVSNYAQVQASIVQWRKKL